MVTRYQLPDAHARAVADVCAVFEADPERGLAEGEAAGRLATCGPNVLTAAAPVPAWRRFLAQFESPLVLLLLAAAIVSLVVWSIEDHGGAPHEALTILAIVALNAVLGYFQEARAARAVAGLAQMTAAMAEVIAAWRLRLVRCQEKGTSFHPAGLSMATQPSPSASTSSATSDWAMAR